LIATQGPAAEAARAYRADNGASAMRLEMWRLAPECETAWRALDEGARDSISFDWEFVPAWLPKRMGWSAET
jgi:hypothetical protein